MAIVKCSECGGKVSTKADKCPTCGAPVVSSFLPMKGASKSSTASGCGGCLLVVVVVMVCSGLLTPSKENANSPIMKTSPPRASVKKTDAPLPSKAIDDSGVDDAAVLTKADVQPASKPADDADDKRVEAWVAAQDFVTDRLKSPSTASFGTALGGDWQDPRKCVTKKTDRTYLVKGWVDSQNSFGGTVRSNFVLTIRDNGGGSWSLIGKPVITQR